MGESHDAGCAFDGKSNRIIEQLKPPQRLRVGIAHDRNLAALFLGDDVRPDEFEIAFLVPCAMRVLCAPLLDQLFEKDRVRQCLFFDYFRVTH